VLPQPFPGSTCSGGSVNIIPRNCYAPLWVAFSYGVLTQFILRQDRSSTTTTPSSVILSALVSRRSRLKPIIVYPNLTDQCNFAANVILPRYVLEFPSIWERNLMQISPFSQLPLLGSPCQSQ
jgi:hypothetical protein